MNKQLLIFPPSHGIWLGGTRPWTVEHVSCAVMFLVVSPSVAKQCWSGEPFESLKPLGAKKVEESVMRKEHLPGVFNGESFMFLVVASVGWSWCLCFFVQSEVFHSRLTGCGCCTARQLDSRRGGTGLRHASCFLLNQSKPHMLQICFVESEMRQTWEILRVSMDTACVRISSENYIDQIWTFWGSRIPLLFDVVCTVGHYIIDDWNNDRQLLNKKSSHECMEAKIP